MHSGNILFLAGWSGAGKNFIPVLKDNWDERRSYYGVIFSSLLTLFQKRAGSDP
jgi:hypothetical protein